MRPQAVTAIKDTVNNQFFFGSTVFRRADGFVKAAFEMAAGTGFNRYSYFGCVLITTVDTLDGFDAIRLVCRWRNGR